MFKKMKDLFVVSNKRKRKEKKKVVVEKKVQPLKRDKDVDLDNAIKLVNMFLHLPSTPLFNGGRKETPKEYRRRTGQKQETLNEYQSRRRALGDEKYN